MRNSTSINGFKAGLDLFKLSKPDLPKGFRKLLEEIFDGISDKREHVNYLLWPIAMLPLQQNRLVLIINFVVLCF